MVHMAPILGRWTWHGGVQGSLQAMYKFTSYVQVYKLCTSLRAIYKLAKPTFLAKVHFLAACARLSFLASYRLASLLV